MIATLRRQSPLVAGLAVVLLTNGVALGGVAHNRGETTGTLALTEREFRAPGFPFRAKENSGLALQLEWRTAREAGDTMSTTFSRFGASTPSWLDSAALARLGFDVSMRAAMTPESQRFYRRQLDREAYFALELDGPASHSWIENIRRRAARDSTAVPDPRAMPAMRSVAQRLIAEELLATDSTGTRLFVVDVDGDLAALRARHPDTTRYAFVRGTVRPRVVSNGSTVGVYGSITLLVRSVNIPHALRGTIVPNGTGVRTGQRWAKPFTMNVGFGRRLEPFIRNTTAGAPAK